MQGLLAQLEVIRGIIEGKEKDTEVGNTGNEDKNILLKHVLSPKYDVNLRRNRC